MELRNAIDSRTVNRTASIIRSFSWQFYLPVWNYLLFTKVKQQIHQHNSKWNRDRDIGTSAHLM